MTSPHCPVCHKLLVSGIRPWHFICRNCKYEGSNLEPYIAATPENLRLDEEGRECALIAIRQRNFKKIAFDIAHLVPLQKMSLRRRLLDVGCAHGWFIQACQHDFDVVGIEPDGIVASAASKRVGPIRQGFFPDVLTPEEKFDVIVFNDVLEHIPDIESVLHACNRHLNEGGWLIVNAPSRHGIIYRVAKLLAHVGFSNSFDRMWQLGFPSPHVHYLDTHIVRNLGVAANFELVKQSSLLSITARGLYSRVRYSKKVSRTKALIITGVLLFAIPLLMIFPPDIKVWYLRKHDEI